MIGKGPGNDVKAVVENELKEPPSVHVVSPATPPSLRDMLSCHWGRQNGQTLAHYTKSMH